MTVYEIMCRQISESEIPTAESENHALNTIVSSAEFELAEIQGG